MSVKRFTISYALSAAAALLVLAGCSDDGRQARADASPIGEPARFDQPPPSQPVLGAGDYVRGSEVMPTAKQKAADPLPPAVPLPAPLAQNEVLAPKSDSTDADQQGGVTPAAGMAAVITNAQGSGEKHKLDGSDVPK